MAKQMNPEDLHAIVGKLLLDEDGFQIDERDAYGRFMTELAELVTEYAGGYVVGNADDWAGEWLVGFEAAADTPDPSVYDAFDTEGELDRR
jgi:hypothetical protein